MPYKGRSATLREAILRHTQDGVPFSRAWREFLDAFYLNPEIRAGALADAPPRIDDHRDALLSATAEHLAGGYGLAVPAWTETQGLPLAEPHYPVETEAMRRLLEEESPAAFRKRNLFVSANALTRASMMVRPEDHPDGWLRSEFGENYMMFFPQP